MAEPRYFGPFFLKKNIQGIEIWNMSWVPDLTWQPDLKVPETDPKVHPPVTCVGIGLEYKCFEKEEIPSIVSKLREAREDVPLGAVTIPKGALKEIAEELDKRSKLPLF